MLASDQGTLSETAPRTLIRKFRIVFEDGTERGEVAHWAA
jgi:hypothetical protein